MIEYAHHRHGEYDVLENSFEGNKELYFEQIDWSSEVEKSNTLERVSPTLSYKEINGDSLIWVSVVGDRDDFMFYSAWSYRGEIRKLFGLYKKVGLIEKKAVFSYPLAKEALNLFLAGSYEKLSELYNSA